MALYSTDISTFFGQLVIEGDEEYLHRVALANVTVKKENAVVQRAKEWLLSYLKKEPPKWIPPLLPARSSFEESVRQVVMEIPFGQCRSYKSIAAAVGKPKAYRAVAMAMKRNPFMIIVPCHRVIASSGIGGYNGGIEIKKKLLEFEACESINF